MWQNNTFVEPPEMVVEFSRSGKPDEAENGSGEPRKKRRTTDAQRAASRKNSLASTGPHDRTRTRFNTVTHGLTCELPVVMPGEDARDVQNRINVYITEQGARTQAEKDLLEVCVMNFVQARRANNANVAAESPVVENVERGFGDEQGRRLATLMEELATSPAATILALRDFSMGVSILLTQVELLEDHLRTNRSFHPSQRIIAIHLCGCKLSHMFIDTVVKYWNIHYLSALHGPGKITADEAAEILQNDRPADVGPEEFARRLGEWLSALVDPRQGHTLLKGTLAVVKAGLLARREVAQEREAEDRERAIEAAKVSVNHECMLRLRYRRECERGQVAAMGKVLQVQAMRLKHPEEIGGLAGGAGEDTAAQAEVQTEVVTPSEPAPTASDGRAPHPAAGRGAPVPKRSRRAASGWQPWWCGGNHGLFVRRHRRWPARRRAGRAGSGQWRARSG
jgi:hypothetical protein